MLSLLDRVLEQRYHFRGSRAVGSRWQYALRGAGKEINVLLAVGQYFVSYDAQPGGLAFAIAKPKCTSTIFISPPPMVAARTAPIRQQEPVSQTLSGALSGGRTIFLHGNHTGCSTYSRST